MVDTVEHVVIKADEEISSGEFNCPICLCDVPRDNVFYLRQCGCGFCRPCLNEYVLLHINEQAIHRLKCPGLHIKDMPLRRNEIKNLISSNDFLTYIRLKHEHAVMQDPSRIFCPWPNCGAVCYSHRLGPRPTRCMTCGFKFCRLCLNAWPGRNHICPEELTMLAKPNGVTPMPSDEKSFVSGAESEAEPNTQEIKSAKKSGQEERIEVKRCPKCGIPIERAAGCHQINCMNCGHSFCWSCLCSLDQEGYMQHILEGRCGERATPIENVGCCRQCLAYMASTAMISSIGCCGLLCAPLTIICAPCIALCIRRYMNQMAQVYVEDDGTEHGLRNNARITGSVEEDTDSEVDSGK